MHVKVVFSSLMHTALGSQGEGVQGSGTVGKEGGVLIVYCQKSDAHITGTRASSESVED